VSIIGLMMWMGAFPFAGLAALTLDVLVIYGLSVTGEYFGVHAMTPEAGRPAGGMPAGTH
jgi:hypothetical protein